MPIYVWLRLGQTAEGVEQQALESRPVDVNSNICGGGLAVARQAARQAIADSAAAAGSRGCIHSHMVRCHCNQPRDGKVRHRHCLR